VLKQTVFVRAQLSCERKGFFIRAHMILVTYKPYHNRSFPRRIKSSLGSKVYGPVCCL